jgi:ABC-type multidrug transport system ATPase subunit
VDVELRLELWQYVQRINEEGTTILLTTHYLEEADQLCNRIAFIGEGRIAATGSSAELAAQYGARGRLPRARRAQGALARAPAGRGVVTATQIRFLSLVRREVNRFLKINLVRYGFLGYTEANVALSLGLLTVVVAALFTLNYRLFLRGYKLRA